MSYDLRELGEGGAAGTGTSPGRGSPWAVCGGTGRPVWNEREITEDEVPKL